MDKQKAVHIDPQDLTPKPINSPWFWLQMVVEPTKMDHYEQSYDQMKLIIQTIANKNPRKLISFFAPMTFVGS